MPCRPCLLSALCLLMASLGVSTDSFGQKKDIAQIPYFSGLVGTGVIIGTNAIARQRYVEFMIGTSVQELSGLVLGLTTDSYQATLNGQYDFLEETSHLLGYGLFLMQKGQHSHGFIAIGGGNGVAEEETTGGNIDYSFEEIKIGYGMYFYKSEATGGLCRINLAYFRVGPKLTDLTDRITFWTVTLGVNWEIHDEVL